MYLFMWLKIGRCEMAWNSFYSSAGIVSSNFKDYESALKHYDTVKPIRGSKPEIRPLGHNRRYTQCKVVHNPLVDSVGAVLYETECVSIFDNGLIRLRHDGWVSPSTAYFIDAVLPRGFGSVKIDKRRLVYVSKEGQQYIIPKDGLWLQADINAETKEWQGIYVIENKLPTEPMYEYKADRKALNAIRKHMKPFLDTVSVMSSMSNTYTIDEVVELFPEVIAEFVDEHNEHERKMRLKEQGEEEFKNYYGHFYDSHTMRNCISKIGTVRLSTLSSLSESVERNKGKTTGLHAGYERDKDFGASECLSYIKEVCGATDALAIRKMMMRIACNGTNYFYEESRHEGQPKHKVSTLFGDVEVPELSVECTKSQIDNYISDIIKYVYADVVFKKVEVAQGKLPSQSNTKYINANMYFVNEQDIVTRRHVVL